MKCVGEYRVLSVRDDGVLAIAQHTERLRLGLRVYMLVGIRLYYAYEYLSKYSSM